MTFSEWIGALPDGTWTALRKYVRGKPDAFKDIATRKAAGEVVANDTALDADAKTALTAELDQAWGVYNVSSVPSPATAAPLSRSRLRAMLIESAPLVVFAIMVILTVGVLAMVFFDDDLLKNLGNTDIARGLITFIYAFGVMLVALILLVALFTSEDEQVGEKFDKAKELFTAMIAILGTILGFYFGQIDSEDTNGVPDPAETQEVVEQDEPEPEPEPEQ